MKIGIIGAGNIGSALAVHFRELHHTVLIANSRGPETLSQVARQTGATPAAVADAAGGVDLLVIAIPMKSVPALPKDLLRDLPSTSPIVDTGNYYPLRDGVIAEIREGMVESEWTSRVLGRPVIKAFNNIVADSLLRKGRPKGSAGRVALPISGDDARSKHIVMALVDEIGFDTVDAGPLSESWHYQPGTPAYCPDANLPQLPLLLARAARGDAPKNRDRAASIMAKLPRDFPPQELVRVSRLSAGLDRWNPRSWIAVARLGFAALRP
jgi:8-hydroxy-5-deazaflavin:NADPH oxidoreductase